MADPALGATLVLLFDGVDPEEIAAALHTAFPSSARYWPVVKHWMRLHGDQAAVLAADDIIVDLEDADEEYIGTREHLNTTVLACDLGDTIWETLRHERDDITKELREQGLIRQVTSEGKNAT
jgi:hypothetical protein